MIAASNAVTVEIVVVKCYLLLVLLEPPAMASSASASCESIVTLFDMKNVIRSDVAAAHDQGSYSLPALIKGCEPTPTNCVRGSNNALRFPRSHVDMEDSKV